METNVPLLYQVLQIVSSHCLIWSPHCPAKCELWRALKCCEKIMLQSMFDAEGKIPVMKPKSCYPGAAFQRIERNIFTTNSHQFPSNKTTEHAYESDTQYLLTLTLNFPLQVQKIKLSLEKHCWLVHENVAAVLLKWVPGRKMRKRICIFLDFCPSMSVL